VEAMAFAWLAQRSLKRHTGNLPEVRREGTAGAWCDLPGLTGE